MPQVRLLCSTLTDGQFQMGSWSEQVRFLGREAAFLGYTVKTQLPHQIRELNGCWQKFQVDEEGSLIFSTTSDSRRKRNRWDNPSQSDDNETMDPGPCLYIEKKVKQQCERHRIDYPCFKCQMYRDVKFLTFMNKKTKMIQSLENLAVMQISKTIVDCNPFPYKATQKLQIPPGINYLKAKINGEVNALEKIRKSQEF